MLLPQTESELAALIDQTNLKPNADQAEMTAYLQDVRAHGYASAARSTCAYGGGPSHPGG